MNVLMNQLQIFFSFILHVQKYAPVTQLMKRLGLCGLREAEKTFKLFCLFQFKNVPHFKCEKCKFHNS